MFTQRCDNKEGHLTMFEKDTFLSLLLASLRHHYSSVFPDWNFCCSSGGFNVTLKEGKCNDVSDKRKYESLFSQSRDSPVTSLEQFCMYYFFSLMQLYEMRRCSDGSQMFLCSSLKLHVDNKELNDHTELFLLSLRDEPNS